MTTQIGFRVVCEKCHPKDVGKHHLDCANVSVAVQDSLATDWNPASPLCPTCGQLMQGRTEGGQQPFPLD